MSTPLKVLFIEDNEDDADLLVRELKRGGYDVTHTRLETADELRAALQNESWDVILSDYTLPTMTGIDALQIYKDSGLDIPFIIVSGTLGEALAVEIMKMGAHDYILKDNKARLNASVKRELAEAEKRRALKRAEAAKREAEEKYRTIFEHAIEGIFRSTPDGRYITTNPAYARMLGYDSPEELIVSVTDIARQIFVDPSRREEMKRALETQERVVGWEHQARRKDGGIIWLSENTRVVRDAEGEIAYYEGMVQDVTERNKVEEARIARQAAERASQAKSEFLSRMSHELRTPMNSILGFTQLLQMDELTPTQMGSLDNILKSGKHLLDLINEVLDIARIEAGGMSVSPEPVQLDEAIRSAADLIRPLADKRGITIEIEVPSLQDIFITADRRRLTQVIINLLSNAVKYNREGGQIYVTASLLVDGFMHLAVRDSGAGIPPEKMERLFTPFDRLELDPDMVEGTGLGLALSKGLVEAMGGRIGAQSVVGEGSTFWLDLQLITPQKEAIVMAEVDDYLKSAPALKKSVVLYVEDNLSNIQLIEKILARLPDVKLISAMQGSLALELARTYQPALILLDLHLPDVHGEVVFQRLRAEPETKDIPVVIMSAVAMHSEIEKMLQAGARAYLTKPIDVKEFLQVVGEMLGEGNPK